MEVQSLLDPHCLHWPATQTGVEPPQQLLPQAGFPPLHDWHMLPLQMSPDTHCDCELQLV